LTIRQPHHKGGFDNFTVAWFSWVKFPLAHNLTRLSPFRFRNRFITNSMCPTS